MEYRERAINERELIAVVESRLDRILNSHFTPSLRLDPLFRLSPDLQRRPIDDSYSTWRSASPRRRSSSLPDAR
jgi:hypothetical protein